jgi:predicted nucleic acid-binding protein
MGRLSKRCSTISLPTVVVADANVVLSALIGGRARLVIASAHGPRCLAVDAVAIEIARHAAPLGEKRKLDPALLLAALQVMPIEWKAATEYEDHREQAESRIAPRDPDDWPTLALALKLCVPIWSQDKDFSTAGVEVVTTGELLDSLRAAGHDLR